MPGSAPPPVSFELFRQDLENLLASLRTTLESGQLPSRLATIPDFHPWVRGQLEVAYATYRSIRYLCADSPPEKAAPLEYGVAVGPLARTVLDQLFAIVLMFDNPAENYAHFLKSLWRENSESLAKHRLAYGADPSWGDWFKSFEALVAAVKLMAGITAGEEANPRLISWWPNPGKMPKRPGMNPLRSSFLQWLNDWFYKNLSGQSHLSGAGFMLQANFFLNRSKPASTGFMENHRSDGFFITLTMILAIASELIVELSLPLAQKAKHLWTFIGAHWGLTKEVYDKRYASIL